MNRKVNEKVVGLLGDILSAEPEELKASFALTAANGVLPIDIAKLAISCEEAFGFSLCDEEIAEWKMVADVCRHIEELIEDGQAEAAEKTEEDRVDWYYESGFS